MHLTFVPHTNVKLSTRLNRIVLFIHHYTTNGFVHLCETVVFN